MRGLVPFASIVLCGLLLAGCAATPGTEGSQNTNDPFEPTNRAIFEISQDADKALFKPIAYGYRDVIPQGVRNSIRNFLNNLRSPAILANDMFQGEKARASDTLIRFSVNSTVGVAGFFDVADEWGYHRHNEDFGQTLAVAGVGEGPYLFMPILGPAPPRDLVGGAVDLLFDPLTYVNWGGNYYIPFIRVAVDAIDLRERNIETLDEIERSSIDYYASVRSLYRQSRNSEIQNGQVDLQDLPDF